MKSEGGWNGTWALALGAVDVFSLFNLL